MNFTKILEILNKINFNNLRKFLKFKLVFFLGSILLVLLIDANNYLVVLEDS